MSEQHIHLCAIGNELVAGQGDARGMGWVSRVIARSKTALPPFVATLAVPGENTSGLAQRWETESASRWSRKTDNRLVIQLGVDDIRTGLSLARSRLNLANILDGAAALQVRCFVVGPPPAMGVEERLVASLSSAFADVCHRRHVPYVETFEALRTNEQWHADMMSNPDHFPGQAGFGLLAWLVLHNGWVNWLGEAADD